MSGVVVYVDYYRKYYEGPYIKSWSSSGIFNWTACQNDAYKFTSEWHARETIKIVYPREPDWLDRQSDVRFIPVL